MTCREVIEFIGQYLDGELTSEQQAAFEYHLTLCDDCGEYLSNYKQTLALGQAALRSDLPAAGEVPEGLIKAVLESLRKHGPPG
jgi:anti-sigma factor RsiW